MLCGETKKKAVEHYTKQKVIYELLARLPSASIVKYNEQTEPEKKIDNFSAEPKKTLIFR